MKKANMRKITLLGVALMTTSAFLGCAKYLDKKVQASALIMAEGDMINRKEKQKMLNEIYSSAKFIPLGEVRDVRYIVEKYLPIGSEKQTVKDTLQQMGVQYEENAEKTEISIYRREFSPFIMPIPVISIYLIFNQENKLSAIKATLQHQQ